VKDREEVPVFTVEEYLDVTNARVMDAYRRGVRFIVRDAEGRTVVEGGSGPDLEVEPDDASRRLEP